MPAHDTEAFEREALPHLDVLYRSARRMAGNARDAEDLVQETMLRAFRFFHQFVPGSNCRAWLLRILHNVGVNAWQRASRGPASLPLQSAADDTPGPLEKVADASVLGPEEAILAATPDTEIVQALDKLPLEYRNAVILCDVEELSYKEIAAILSVPIGTVRSRLARGRGMLARLLVDHAGRRP